MKNVIVGSNNPVKLQATKKAFEIMFPDEAFAFQSCSAASGVSDQPMDSQETRRGAENRALDCRSQFPEADYYVGLEGGLEKEKEEYWAFAWMCVIDASDRRGYGRTGSYLLPQEVCARIEAGEELGHASDAVFEKSNSKQAGGTVGILTNERLTRTDFYTQAIIFALIPHIKRKLY